jgi:hypothetical protein
MQGGEESKDEGLTKKGGSMHRQFIRIASLSLILLFIFQCIALADGAKSTVTHVDRPLGCNPFLFEKDPTNWNRVMDEAWGQMAPLSENQRNATVTRNKTVLKENAWIYSSYPELEITLSRPETDGVQGCKILQKADDPQPSIIVGLKYTFKKFRLHRFHRSIRSFLTDSARAVPDRSPSVAFFFEIP